MKHQVRLPVMFLSNDDHGLTSCYLIGRIGFSTGKSENSGLSENFGAGDLKVGRCRQLIQFMKYVHI